ncbi:MAG: hypothetical protein LUG66_08545 [Clostridiales bacterium]|nr:hypothetical protein [Clostridiales bacterium]
MGGGTGGSFGNTRGRKKSKSQKDSHLYGKPGQIKRSGYKETLIGSDGRAVREKHNTDHGNPKYHDNPHYHDIKWDENGNPIFMRER